MILKVSSTNFTEDPGINLIRNVPENRDAGGKESCLGHFVRQL